MNATSQFLNRPLRTEEEARRALLQKLFIRVCTDSRFRMDAVDAGHFVASIAHVHPLQVVGAVGFDNMLRIAMGDHPVCNPSPPEDS